MKNDDIKHMEHEDPECNAWDCPFVGLQAKRKVLAGQTSKKWVHHGMAG